VWSGTLILTPNLPSPKPVTTPILWTAVATGGTAPEFCFWVQPARGPFSLAQDCSSSNTFAWVPTAAGDYSVCVWARSSGSSKDLDADACQRFQVSSISVTLSSNLPSPQPAGTPILWTATPAGGTAPQFQF